MLSTFKKVFFVFEIWSFKCVYKESEKYIKIVGRKNKKKTKDYQIRIVTNLYTFNLEIIYKNLLYPFFLFLIRNIYNLFF